MFDLPRFRIQAIYRFILWAKKSKSIRADYDFSENNQHRRMAKCQVNELSYSAP